jgi:hypothetical protein
MDEKGECTTHMHACIHGKRKRGHMVRRAKSSLLTRIRSACAACQRASATHRNARNALCTQGLGSQHTLRLCSVVCNRCAVCAAQTRVWEPWTLGNRGMRRRRSKKRFVHLLHDAGPCSEDDCARPQGESGTDLLVAVSPSCYQGLVLQIWGRLFSRIRRGEWWWRCGDGSGGGGGGVQQFIRVVFVRRHVTRTVLGNPELFTSRSLLSSLS